MSNQTLPETLITMAMTTVANVTSVNATSTAATTTTTVVTTESSTSTSTSTTSTVSSTTQSKSAALPTTPAARGSPAGAIAGGVAGGLVLVAVLIVLLVLFRRRQKQKARKRSNIPLAPGKDDIDKIETENSRKHNQYSPPPTRECKPDDLYANLNKEGNPNESTDPALDAMGYLKTKIKQQKEPGSELYYETKSEKDMHKKKKGLKNKKGHKNKKRKKEKFDVNNEQQPVYENKDVHTNAAFEQPDYLDLTNSADNTKDDQHKVNGTTNNGYIEDDEYVDPDRSDKIHVTPETATSSHDKHSNHVKKDNAPVYKNENVKAKTDKTVEAKADKNVKAKTDKIPVSTDENDEEYEVPDNYPEPKKPPSRTYVTDTKHHKGNKSHVKEKTKTKEVKKVIGTNDNKANTDSGKQKEIKYENIKDSGKYVNVGETNELVSDDYYEVPENK